MKNIPIFSTKNPGLFALVSDEDFERVSAFRWTLVGGYAARQWKTKISLPTIEQGVTVTQRHTQSMHRLVMNCEPNDGKLVDHINRNRLDNRRENLRFVSAGENARNSGGYGASGHKGVYKYQHKPKSITADGTRVIYVYERWRAEVQIGPYYYRKGGFKTLEEALAWRTSMIAKSENPPTTP